MTKLEPTGWGWPAMSKKAHYFRGGHSLCLKWMYFGALTEEDGKKSQDDCAACRRAVDAMAKAKPFNCGRPHPQELCLCRACDAARPK